MTRQQVLGIVAAAVVSTLLVVGAGVLLLPGDDPAPAPHGRRLARLEADGPRGAGHDRGAAVGAGQADEEAARPVARPRRLDPAAKRKPGERPSLAASGNRPRAAAARTRDPEARAARREETLARRTRLLEDYARAQGWDDATIEEVGAIMTETTDYVSGTLARIAAGEDVATLREEIRAFRQQQAEAMKGVVGEDEYPAFVAAVHMERFFGQGGAGRPRAGARRTR